MVTATIYKLLGSKAAFAMRRKKSSVDINLLISLSLETHHCTCVGPVGKDCVLDISPQDYIII